MRAVSRHNGRRGFQIIRSAIAAQCVALMSCIAPSTAPPAGSPNLRSTRVASGLTHPVFVAAPPGDMNRLFIVEKAGVIQILELNTGQVNATPFLDINSLVGGGTVVSDERGLLGLAFHPAYANNRFFYVNYTDTVNRTVIARYTVSANPNIADENSALRIMIIAQPQTNHNGGWIGFGPHDAYLYIATGDGGNFCDTGTGHTSGTGNAQDTTNNLLGKILRLDVDGNNGPGGSYGIPESNPFVGITGDDEIWSYGLRNPWRCSFDRGTGDLYIGDVGQGAREEVDYQPAASMGGENYGWRCMEGDVCSSASGCSTTGCTCSSPSLSLPLHVYSHNPPPPPARSVCSVIGGYVYRGSAIHGLAGTYFFADFCGNAVWSSDGGGGDGSFNSRTADLSPSIEGFAVNEIVSFGEDAAGELYIVDQGVESNEGRIFKIIATATPAT